RAGGALPGGGRHARRVSRADARLPTGDLPPRPAPSGAGRSRSRPQVATQLPEVRVELPLRAPAQVPHPGAPAGARLVADQPLHHGDVAQAPEPEGLVVLDQRLREEDELVALLHLLVDAQQLADPPLVLLGLRR